MDPFRLEDPVPAGITVLEASAGTGKTYTIAALSARLVAEGTPLEQLLLVTFTRMATGELRERVRERLLWSERALASIARNQVPERADELDWVLGSVAPEEVERRRLRLADALANFDAATIETTHGFCLKVLEELGTLGDLEPGVEIVERIDDVLDQVVDDLYVRRFVTSRGKPPIDRAQAGEIARAAVASADAIILPDGTGGEGDAAMRARLAQAVRRELRERLRSLGLLTYDEMLLRLLRTLRGPEGEEAARRLRRRYGVVLIDEFQDTDPIQWEIVERAFGDGTTQLVLIADPKQAIYAFRGADVFSYLRAAEVAGARRTLTVNRRSDADLLAAFDALFADARLGHEGIAYRQVSATPAHHGSRLSGLPSPGSLRFRILDRQAVTLTPSGSVQADAGRRAVAADVAADVVRVLQSEARITARNEDGTEAGERTVAPGDIAVLVPRHATAAMVQSELELAGVPVVIAGAGSVFATPAAEDWRRVLEALERPAAQRRVRTAALTPLLGWDAAGLAEADESALEALHARFYRWSRVFAEQGMAALDTAVMQEARVAPRLLGVVGGERKITDLQHVAELLHRAAVEEGLGLAALAGWLRQRIAAATREGAHGDERTRRLDSDAEAVQVLTIHRSKGLEWPIVYSPYLWDIGRFDDRIRRPVTFHLERERAVDVGLEGAGYDAHRKRHLAEERGEDLRLAYVALTRARHLAVVHWAGSWDARNSPLGRLLFARDAAGNVAVSGPGTPSEAELRQRLERVASDCAVPGAVAVESFGVTAPARWAPPPATPTPLQRARFNRSLDLRWRRTSYSALTAASHEGLSGPRLVGSEPEVRGIDDEPEVVYARPATDGGPPESEPMLPLAEMAAGPQLGTLIHRVLERVDFAAPDPVAEFAEVIAEVAGGRGAELLGTEVGMAASGLAGVVETPLWEGGFALREVPRGDRLDELTFELPLAGGDRPAGPAVALRAVADLLERFPLGPLAGYPELLRDPLLANSFRGYLTGSIDAVIRVASTYRVLDYKTNWLAGPDESLRLWHYREAALREEMERSHYALQALLYLVALHRFLRWRVPGYDPDRDLGPVHYLFLRGMVGAAAPGAGVFTWQPPTGLVPALSDLLDAGGLG